jgi:hypothetical protein
MPDRSSDPFARLSVLQEQIRLAMQPAAEMQRRVIRGFSGANERMLASLQRTQETMAQFAEAMQRQLEEALPANWRGMSARDISRALDMALASGVSVVWVPRADIVRALLDAPNDTAREAVLIERTGDVLDDLAVTLAEATHPELGHIRKMAAEAIAACVDGHFAPGQSHAAAALSGAVHDYFGEERFNRARERFEKDHPDDVELALLRMTTLLRVLARALQHTDYAAPGFNRHASLHGRSPEQHNQANALAALLLLVGLLRELHVWFEQDDAEAADEVA